MVRKDPAVYLFVGEDRASKETNIQKIKSLYLASGIEQFNLDVLYARDVNLPLLQERVLALPVQSKKRVVIIKQAQELKPNIKDFISQYAQSGDGRTVIILDMERGDKGHFVADIGQWGQVMRFKEAGKVDTFTLARFIDVQNSVAALRVLNDLLREGQSPEWIIGGLRYSWERYVDSVVERRRRLKLLLACDGEIKTGKLPALLALEKLVVSLCGRRGLPARKN